MAHGNHGTAAEGESYEEELERWTAEGGSSPGTGAAESEAAARFAAEHRATEGEPADG